MLSLLPQHPVMTFKVTHHWVGADFVINWVDAIVEQRTSVNVEAHWHWLFPGDKNLRSVS